MQHVFIVGSKGIPARYGGFETFVDKLTENKKSNEIQYHVACAVDDRGEIGEFEHNSAKCYNVLRKPIGPAKAIFYDMDAFKQAISTIKKQSIEHPIVYVLACRLGPFFNGLVKEIHDLGGLVFVNPDGHEWRRAKWSAPVRAYWKFSEKTMIRHADKIVCDSLTIEKYIQEEYSRFDLNTTYIAYGAEDSPSFLKDNSPEFMEWLQECELEPYEYYLVVGRFVPENNYETMLREFMRSNSKKSFAIVTHTDEAFLKKLDEATNFKKDKRIKFVGTVYDQQLLKKIRENAYAYFHGHEVGGTNPSLLEALASTQLNLLLDVGFNREVAETSALYWTKEERNLSNLIDKADRMSSEEIRRFNEASSEVIKKRFSWDNIVKKYENLFLAQH